MKRRLVVALTALALCLGFVLTGNAAPAQASTTAGLSWPAGTVFWSSGNSAFISAYNSTGCDRFVVDSEGARLVARTSSGPKTVWQIPWEYMGSFNSAEFNYYWDSSHQEFLGLQMLIDRDITQKVNFRATGGGVDYRLDWTLNLESDGNLVIRDGAKSILSTGLAPCVPPPTPVWTEGSTINIGAIWWNGCVAMWVDNYGLHLGDSRGRVLFDLLFKSPYTGTGSRPYAIVARDKTIYGTGTYLEVRNPWAGWDPLVGFDRGPWVGGYNSDPGNRLPGKMVLQSDGNLVLLDGLGTLTWASNTNIGYC